MADITRRSLIFAGVGTAALLTLGGRPTFSTLTTVQSERVTRSRAHSVLGTTLEQTATPASSKAYSRLTAGPGYPLVVREDLAKARRGRDDTRAARASIVQFTDLHLIDAQSPMRFEYLAATAPPFFRPQESLGTQAAAQLVARVNHISAGPFSGRPFDCVVSTGDNSDNNETLELDWFLTVMSGGSITPDSGRPGEWEGVQHSGDGLYYNPAQSVRDRYKKQGFPHIDGFFDRVVRPHTSEGLRTPWYSVFGNHDDSIGGSLPVAWSQLEELYTGTTKFTGFTTDAANTALAAGLASGRPGPVDTDLVVDPRWQVTPDVRRAPFTPREFMRAHLEPAAVGAGPSGHGFTRDAVDAGITYYTFAIAPGITGISLDSTNRAGGARGSLGAGQLAWLESVLRSGSSTYYDAAGAKVAHPGADELFVVFSHHTSGSMDNVAPSPDDTEEPRRTGTELVSLLLRFPNVLAWVNGHSHRNAIRAQPGPSPERGFWEINTASHVDFPQQARIIEVCDNHDGTLSLFTTLIESEAPYQADYGDGSQAALASLYRELSFNDLSYTGTHAGNPTDQNTELLLVHPLA